MGTDFSESRQEGFESAVEAVISGDTTMLEQLLAADPTLVRSRSAAHHRATLLHYVSANGVEDERQLSPSNAAVVAEILLAAGAEVDAECNVYGGGWTTLALTASSEPPRQAGVQIPVLQMLLDRGADIDRRAGGGVGDTALVAAICNGQNGAAEFLADRGASLDLGTASAVGNLGVVKSLWGGSEAAARSEQERFALTYACLYGRAAVVQFLLESGVNVAAQDGHGQSGLHYAALGAYVEIVDLLIAHGAPLELKNVWGGTALGQATWAVVNEGSGGHVNVVQKLLDAGAQVQEADYPTGSADVDAVLRQYGAGAE